MFVAQNLSGNVIALMGDRPLEGRPWIFKIPRDKQWAWSEVKCLSNPIEMQTHFSQEENRHAMWDTTGMKNLTTLSLPRLAVVPYYLVEWLSKKGLTLNELRIWLETMITTDVNFIKDDWGLFFEFSMSEAQMYPNDKKQYLGHGSGTSHRHRPKNLEMRRPEIGCYIGNKTNKISSNDRERYITDLLVLLGNFNKGYGQ